MDRYNSMENEMGISTFASTQHDGFAAVSKARYSDFVVHEVDMDGKMARLDSLAVASSDQSANTEEVKETTKEVAKDESSNRKRKLTEGESSEKSGQGDQTSTLVTTKDWKEGARSQLSEWVGSEVAEKVVAMLLYWEESKGEPPERKGATVEKNVTLPPIAEKTIRRAVHEWIRSSLTCARADTIDGKVRIWHVRFEKEMPNYKAFGNNNRGRREKPKKQPWPADRPDFLKFVLYKENTDTSMAIKEICSALERHKKNRVRVGYAGMKDKRGVTAQFCTLYQKDASELIQMNRLFGRNRGGGNSSHKGVSVMRVGNCEYVDKEIKLGMLKGNHFDVVLRNVEAPKSDSDGDRIAHTKQCLTKAATSLRDYGFINYFGMQRFGKFYDTHKVGIAVLKGNFEEAVDIIMRPKGDDEPFRFTKARTEWKNRFENMGEADDEEKQQQAKIVAESKAAKHVIRDFGRFMTCEVAILKSLIHKPLDYKRAFAAIPKNLRLMFLHALQSYVWNHIASQRIDKSNDSLMVGDLVLLKDSEHGSDTSGLGSKKVKVVSEEDLAKGTVDITDLVLPLVGSKIQYPENESGKLFDTILEKEGLSKKAFVKVADRELALGGDYRKVVCKPTNVDFEIKEYRDPHQPLLQTDLMKLDGVLPDIKKRKVEPQQPDAGEGSAVKATKSCEGPSEEKPILLGMVIGFTLPASAYATMTLRELMKRPTSSDYQRQLLLEGPCERNLLQKKDESKKQA